MGGTGVAISGGVLYDEESVRRCSDAIREQRVSWRDAGLTQESDRFRKVSVRQVGPSDIAVGRGSGGGRSDGRRAPNMHGLYEPPC